MFAAIAAAALVLLAAVLWVPALADLFRFAPPPGRWLALAAATAAAMLLGLRAVRAHGARRPPSRTAQ